MSSTDLLTKDRPPASRTAPGGTGLPPVWSGDGSGPGDGGAHPVASAADPGVFAVAAVLAAVTMLFVAFTTAYLARRQEVAWPAITLPPILWVNTLALLLSSGALEWGRWQLRRGRAAELHRALRATAVLGMVFVAGQLVAWRQLASQGIYLATNPHSAFFYLLTGTHGLHLLGGLLALAVVLARSARGRYTPEAHGGLTAFALYWHFMDALWAYVFVLLFWL